jgi:trans-2,3-dihydro-3-hydroxyanthranilate isomerase
MSEPIEILAAFDPLVPYPSSRSDAPRPARYVLLDVFTDTPLQGNQLAVFPDGRRFSGEQMQRVARELKLSETVFGLPSAGADLAVRIFTPAAELPFAGHPVLGTAILLARALEADEVTLETGMGRVQVALERKQGRVVSGVMQQPIPSWAEYEHPRELLSALGVERSGLPVEVYDNGPSHVYVELESEAAVAALSPDLGAVARLSSGGVSCFAGSHSSWKTRNFAPALGVPEDPATGSAAGPLAVHLCRHGRLAFGREIEIRQGAEIERPSLLRACVHGSVDRIERVDVGGAAVVVGHGELAPG